MVRLRPPRLQAAVDEAQAEAHVEHRAASGLHRQRVRFHERMLPPHHHRAIVLIDEPLGRRGRRAALVTQPLSLVVGRTREWAGRIRRAALKIGQHARSAGRAEARHARVVAAAERVRAGGVARSVERVPGRAGGEQCVDLGGVADARRGYQLAAEVEILSALHGSEDGAHERFLIDVVLGAARKLLQHLGRRRAARELAANVVADVGVAGGRRAFGGLENHDGVGCCGAVSQCSPGDWRSSYRRCHARCE